MGTLRLLLCLQCVAWCWVVTGCASARPYVESSREVGESPPVQAEQPPPRRAPLTAPPLMGKGWFDEVKELLPESTVALLDEGRMICTGVLAVRSDVVATTLHCLEQRERGEYVAVMLADGSVIGSRLEALDEATDMAVLLLEEPAPFTPMPIADSDLAVRAEPFLFLGLPEAGRKVVTGVVLKRAQCPSLQAVEDALFTSIQGRLGDSGAAMAAKGGIIALVHGGARCNIAIPSNRLQPLVQQVLEAHP